MKNFLSNYPIYCPYLLSNSFKVEFYKKTFLKDETFDYYCSNELGVKTFKIDFPERSTLISLIQDGDIPFENLKNKKLDYVFECYGRCQSCKNTDVNFMLHVFEKLGDDQKKNIIIEKVGINPKRVISPKIEISKFFDRESNNWYYKGINAIEENYGIGSLAYFRRIVEKELMHIIKEIKELPDSHGLEIQKLLDEHELNGTVSSIYDNIFHHLPSSLKSLGDNPIKLLYNQTSEGLHSMKEDEALEKARLIQKLLDFVIVKINEERSNIKDLKEAIRGLKRE